MNVLLVQAHPGFPGQIPQSRKTVVVVVVVKKWRRRQNLKIVIFETDLTSDDLESHIVVNVSSTLTNTTIWFVAALSLIVDVRTHGWTDIFTGFIRSSLRR